MAEHSNALGSLIYDYKQLIALLLKKQMHAMEIRSLCVPMRFKRFCLQQELICKYVCKRVRNFSKSPRCNANFRSRFIIDFTCSKKYSTLITNCLGQNIFQML